MSRNQKRVFIIHGYKSYPGDCWFPWFKKELLRRGITAFVLKMPSPARPDPKQWVSTIAKKVGVPDKNTFFVGHSLGVIAIIRYLETLPPSQKIGGAVFVAGRIIARTASHTTSPFFKKPINWRKLKNLSKRYIGIYSIDDYLVSTDNGRLLKKEVDAKFVLEKSKGHFSRNDGVSKLPIVLQTILELSK